MKLLRKQKNQVLKLIIKNNCNLFKILVYYICKCYLYWVTPYSFWTLFSSGVFVIVTTKYDNSNDYHELKKQFITHKQPPYPDPLKEDKKIVGAAPIIGNGYLLQLLFFYLQVIRQSSTKVTKIHQCILLFFFN